MNLRVGDRVKANKKSPYWHTDDLRKLQDEVFIIKRVDKSLYCIDSKEVYFIYFHPKYDWNCYATDLIKIDNEWD